MAKRATAAARKSFPVPAVVNPGGREMAVGGALEGAERTQRETVNWQPSTRSPDQFINRVKPMADARGQDMDRNDGLAHGVVTTHKDYIVGAHYRLSCKPSWKFLGADEGWANEMQEAVEELWTLSADSPACWLDNSRTLNFTEQIRMGIGVYVATGESLSTCEWIRDDPSRPFKTAIQLLAPALLSNPNNVMDTKTLRAGVQKNNRGAPVGYYFRNSFPSEFYAPEDSQWRYVKAYKPWGRPQVFHALDPRSPGQTRGIADMVAVLQKMRMTKHFHEITLQAAVVQASYAAAIESELPNGILQGLLGADGDAVGGYMSMIGAYMEALSSYLSTANNINIDGAQMPHLFPGTKLNLMPMGTPGGVGTGFEASLNRHICSALGVSYEEYTNDYSETNYSSAKAASAKTERGMNAKKAIIANRNANGWFGVWFEEMWNAKRFPMMKKWTTDKFYDPLCREAFTRADWIGSGQGQIDEQKETEAAARRIEIGISTLEIECARLGKDYREIILQRARELRMLAENNIPISTTAPAQGNTPQDNSDQRGKGAK